MEPPSHSGAVVAPLGQAQAEAVLKSGLFSSLPVVGPLGRAQRSRVHVEVLVVMHGARDASAWQSRI